MSLQSIMVFILAFIVMGILIAVINAIFDPIREGVQDLTVTDIDTGSTWGKEPDRQNPVVIDTQIVSLKPLQTRDVDLGIYNREAYTFVGNETGTSYFNFSVSRCRDFDGSQTADTVVPSLAAIRELAFEQTVRPGDVRKFRAQIRDEGLPPNQQYSCTIEVRYNGTVSNHPISGTVGVDNVLIGQASFNLNIE